MVEEAAVAEGEVMAAGRNESAIIDLVSPDGPGGFVYLLVKETYSITDSLLSRIQDEPLVHDIRREDIQPRVSADTDYWPVKYQTDVVVQGFAFTNGLASQRSISVRVGERTKRVSVFGRRSVHWDSTGQAKIEGPDSFKQVPLTYEHAYGGCDWTVEPLERHDPLLPFKLEFDHPGLYPRNPFGKGYLVRPEACSMVELPNLENPQDLLTKERLTAGDPRLWYKQPIPWCMDWVHPGTFPRNTLLLPDVDAWYPGPEDDRMPEVEGGIHPKGYRSFMAERDISDGAHPLFYQGGSACMVFDDLRPGTPIELEGMHPEKDLISFQLPVAPKIRISIDGNWQLARPNLHHLVCRPAEHIVNVVYGAQRELPRPFFPGIHKKIPVAATVEGQGPIEYQTPPTIRDQLSAAEEAQKNKG